MLFKKKSVTLLYWLVALVINSLIFFKVTNFEIHLQCSKTLVYMVNICTSRTLSLKYMKGYFILYSCIWPLLRLFAPSQWIWFFFYFHMVLPECLLYNPFVLLYFSAHMHLYLTLCADMVKFLFIIAINKFLSCSPCCACKIPAYDTMRLFHIMQISIILGTNTPWVYSAMCLPLAKMAHKDQLSYIWSILLQRGQLGSLFD